MMARWVRVGLVGIVVAGLIFIVLAVLFDQAVFVRRGTFYRAQGDEKVVALTFDDGPSPRWTPEILDILGKENVKATFFMIGEHVLRYPEVARRVAVEGHEIGNHSFDHKGIFFYTPEEAKKEVVDCEKVIQSVTGVTTKYFRPPKAWINDEEKAVFRDMGYKVILWSLNSKDWVTFDDKYIVKFLVRNVRPGDVILFHDSGGVLGTEGGDRSETVKTLPMLIEKLKTKGYRFVTISEMLKVKTR